MDKLSVVTGATSGIGYQTALQLAQYNQQLILVLRDRNKGTYVRDEIIKQVPGARVELVVADLSSQSQIREAAQQIKQLTTRIDVLVNNAGTWYSSRNITEDNIEKVFAVNHLSYFLLTHLLYPELVKAGAARIINVSSDSHFKAKMHFNDLGLEKNYHGLRSYGQSKLANVLFTHELDRQKIHQQMTVNAVQPGLVKTDIGIKNTTWLHALAWKFRRSSGVSAAEGAATSVYLANSEEVQGMSGRYWADCRPKPSSTRSYNIQDAQKLWDISEKMCGITNYFERH